MRGRTTIAFAWNLQASLTFSEPMTMNEWPNFALECFEREQGGGFLRAQNKGWRSALR